MSLRTRFAVSSIAVTVLVVVVLSAALYVTVSRALHGQVDRSLEDRPSALARQPGIGDFSQQLGDCRVLRLRSDLNLDRGGFLVLVDERRRSCTTPAGAPALPSGLRAVGERAARADHRDVRLDTVRLDGERYRVATARLRDGLAVQVARPLEEIDSFLARLRLVMLGVSLVALVVAAELGAIVARYAIAPVRRLTDVVERIAHSRDLHERVGTEVTGSASPVGDTPSGDEVRRLAARFDAMLDSLADARVAHERLISDASHELRTPLTSIRSNVEVLALSERLPEQERRELVDDIVRQFEELTATVNNVIDLARSAEPLDDAAESVALDELVDRAVDRARLHSPQLDVVVTAAPCIVRGSAPRLQTAVNNLVDNACRHGADGGRVDVRLDDGLLTVRDYGPGFVEADLPHVFDRYYRSRSSRAVAGSGLGLAIVQQVAETHGGSVIAANADGGGAVLSLRLPRLDAGEDPR